MSSTSLLSSQKIVFIGAGAMTEALLRGLVHAHLIHASSLFALNRHHSSRLLELQNLYGIQIPLTNTPDERAEIVSQANIVVLAMKPKDVGSAITEFCTSIRDNQFIISLVAGLSIDTIEQMLKRSQPIARTMPNTSSTIGLGATGLAFSASVNNSQKQMARDMFGAVGLVISLEERMLNLVTGLSGSGPAYVYYLMEAMISAGVAGGLSEEDSQAFVLQTVLGAAQMVKNTGESPAELRAKVTSPNGTTFAAIRLLEQNQFREMMMKAIAHATDRANELGNEIAIAALQSAATKETSL
jgi:pyrroline-5-carboxylate reductase